MECSYLQRGDSVPFTPVAAATGGGLVPLRDGRAAYAPAAIAAGVAGNVHPQGLVKVAKTAGIALLKGGDVFWDVSEAKAHFKPGAGSTDFFLGTVWED